MAKKTIFAYFGLVFRVQNGHFFQIFPPVSFYCLKRSIQKKFFSGHPTLHPPPHLWNSRLRCCFPPKHKASSKDIIVSSSSPSTLLLSFPSEVSPKDILKNLLVPHTDPIVGSSSSFSSLNSRLRCCSPFYPLSAPHPSWIQISSQNHNAQNVH